MSPRQSYIKQIGAFNIHRNDGLSGFHFPFWNHFSFKSFDALHKAIFKQIDGFAFFNWGVGQHGKDFRFGLGANQQQFGNGHQHLGIDAERTVHHAAAAPRAGISRFVQLFQSHFTEFFGLTHRWPNLAPALKIFLIQPPHDFAPISSDVPDLPHGSIHMTGLDAYTAAGAVFQIKTHGLV